MLRQVLCAAAFDVSENSKAAVNRDVQVFFPQSSRNFDEPKADIPNNNK